MTTATRPQKEPVGAWDEAALADPHAQQDKSARVQAMFDAIAPTYERVNKLATFGRDAAWRKAAVRAAQVKSTDVVLDVACGTGDMIRTFAAHDPPPARIVGLDFAASMLSVGTYDGVGVPIQLLRGDAQALPLRDASVDVVTCAFGVRNFQQVDVGLREMFRVLRPGGRLVILEFTTPSNPVLRWIYELYCNTVLPRLGTWISRDRTGAYRYLPKSIHTFDTPPVMLRRLTDSGFCEVSARTLHLGGVAIYRGRKG